MMEYEEFLEIEKKHKDSNNEDMKKLIKHTHGIHELLGHHVRILEQIYLKAGETISYDAPKSDDKNQFRPSPRYG